MKQQMVDLLNRYKIPLIKSLAEAEDDAFFVGTRPLHWPLDTEPVKLTNWQKFRQFRFKVEDYILKKTKGFRWWVANTVAPDIHDDCNDYD